MNTKFGSSLYSLAAATFVAADNLCKQFRPRYKPFDILIVFQVNFEKKSPDDNKSVKSYPACKELKIFTWCFGFCLEYQPKKPL